MFLWTCSFPVHPGPDCRSMGNLSPILRMPILVASNSQHMNCTASCLAEIGLTPAHLMQLAFAAFTAVLFLQSSLDKLFNWKGQKEYLTKQFSKSPLHGSVPLLLPVITLVEFAAGLLCALGFGQVLLNGNTGLGTLGMGCAVIALIMLFFGQRMAKDYGGAAALVPYFLMAAAGLWFFLA